MSFKEKSKHKEDEEEEEVEDYMSNEILNQINDTRPGLVYSKSVARKYETEKRREELNQKNRQLPIKVLEQKVRDEALSKSSLTSDNKGLNMMLKMGYKSGQSLGKEPCGSGSSGTKIIEPISVLIKADREGLGQAEEKKRKLDQIKQLQENLHRQRVENEKTQAQSYLDSKRSKFQLRKTLFSLRKCQRICFQLDSTERNLNAPEISWYWPISIRKSIKKAKREVKKNINITESKQDDHVFKVPFDVTLVEANHSDTTQVKVSVSIPPKDTPMKLYEKNLDAFLKNEDTSVNKESEVEAERTEDSDDEGNEEIDELTINQRDHDLASQEKCKSGDNDEYFVSENDSEDDDDNGAEEEDDEEAEGNEEVYLKIKMT